MLPTFDHTKCAGIQALRVLRSEILFCEHRFLSDVAEKSLRSFLIGQLRENSSSLIGQLSNLEAESLDICEHSFIVCEQCHCCANW